MRKKELQKRYDELRVRAESLEKKVAVQRGFIQYIDAQITDMLDKIERIERGEGK